MNRNILKAIVGLLMLMFVFTANTYSQSTSTEVNGTTLIKKVLIVLSAADTWTRAKLTETW